MDGHGRAPAVLMPELLVRPTLTNLDETTRRALDLTPHEELGQPFFLRLLVLWLMTITCYGVQAFLEKQRLALEEAAEFAAREGQLRSAGRLAAEFAHQIKNPLAVIRNAAHSLERSVRENKKTAAQQIEIIQEEVKKPAYPKSRGRRVLKYMDTGVQKQTVKAGDYTEEFEIPGDPANARPAEVRITLPSYQVGISIDPRFPMFKIITYNGNEGFDLFDVQKFYGGAELVPAEIKRKYVENTLCYDIRTVVRAIETEYRQLVLAKGRA